MKFTVTLQDREVQQALQGLIDRGTDLRPAYRAIGQALKSRVLLTFRSGADPYGTPWKPLKVRQGQPLRDTGRLMRSTTFRALQEALYIGAATEYAATHQFGVSGPVRIPAHQVQVKAHTKTQAQAWGQPIPPRKVKVRAHTKNMPARVIQQRIPARPFLPTDGLPPAWATDVLDLLQRHILGAGRGSG